MTFKYFMVLTLLCCAMAARVKRKQQSKGSQKLVVDEQRDGTEKDQMSSMNSKTSNQSSKSKQSDQSHKSAQFDQSQESTQTNEQSNAEEKQADPGSLASLASPDSEKDEGKGLGGGPAESDDSGETRMILGRPEDIEHREDSDGDPEATEVTEEPGEIEEPLGSDETDETSASDCDKPDNDCGGIVAGLKKLWKKIVKIVKEPVTKFEEGMDFEDQPAINHSLKCTPGKAPKLDEMTVEKDEENLPKEPFPSLKASQSFLEAHEVSSILGLNFSGKAGMNVSKKAGAPTNHHEVVSALIGLQTDTSDRYICDGSEWSQFAKRFSVTRNYNQCPHPNDDFNTYSDTSRCSDKNVLFLYPRHDHNAAFCIDKRMCTRLNNWYSHACSVHLHRVSYISRASSVLDKFGDNSLKHVVLGGHGSGWSLEWGHGGGCGSTDLCVSSPGSRSFLQKLSRKMHQHASIFMDSCSSATESSYKKKGGMNLAEYVASVVGKGIRVIGASHSFGAAGFKVTRYIAWHATIDTRETDNAQRTHVASGGRCPSWAKGSTPDSDGDCACPSGKACKTTEGKDCPRSKGQTSSTYFLPMCVDSWSKVTCKCVTSGSSGSGSSGSSDDNRVAWIKQKYEHTGNNRHITQQTFGGKRGWVVFHDMYHGSGYWRAQTEWRTSWSDLKTWIRGKWNDDYELTSIRYGLDGKWAAVATKGTCVTGSGWQQKDTFEKAKTGLREAWDKGARLLDISYGNGQYMLTTGKCSELKEQSYKKGTWSEVKSFISQKWDVDYYITSFTRLRADDHFFVMMSKNPHFTGQSYAWKKASDVQSWIKEKWDEKYQITTIFDDYEKDSDSRYFVVMSKVSGSNFFPNQGAYGTYNRKLTL